MTVLKIQFSNGIAKVELRDGKTAYIYENRSGYYRRMMYTLEIDGEIIFTRGSMEKVRQQLYKMI